MSLILLEGHGPNSLNTITIEQLTERIRWVRALRSGEYSQITQTLRQNLKDGKVGYCCLGVACEVSPIGEWRLDSESVAPGEKPEETWWYRSDSGDEVSTEMPIAVAKAMGLNDGAPCISARGLISDTVIIYNDAQHWTFEQIADGVERDYITPYGSETIAEAEEALDE